ncbi:dnaJ homolog subfamily C member 16 isoform X2 [Lampetra fluviatilis]
MEVMRLVWIFLCLLPRVSGLDFDPYAVLGVARSAPQSDIKKAYKALAREWHPDKNRDPNAEDRFVEITKAYEVLSNEEKRSQYDRFGSAHGGGAQFQQGGNFHHHDPFSSFFAHPYFSSFFQEDERLDGEEQVGWRAYEGRLLKASSQRPFMLRVTSRACLACRQMLPMWKSTAPTLLGYGVGVGMVDGDVDARLVMRLGVRTVPAVVAVLSGKSHVFSGTLSRDALLSYLDSLLPSQLVQTVDADSIEPFLQGAVSDSKPRALLFSARTTPSLLYKLTAFAYWDYVRFGFASGSGGHHKETLRRFGVNAFSPTLLLFKESPVEPADILQTKDINREALDEIISRNKFLVVPRLTSQKVFEELCPARGAFQQNRPCVVLVSEDLALISGLLNAASMQAKAQFTHVLRDTQPDFTRALANAVGATGENSVIAVWRESPSGRAACELVADHWKGLEWDVHFLLERVDDIVGRGMKKLPYLATLPHLHDENTPNIIVRWYRALEDIFSEIWSEMHLIRWRELMPVLSLVFSVIFVLFGTFIINAFSDTPSSGRERERRQSPQSSSRPATSSQTPPGGENLELTELTGDLCSSYLGGLRPGHMTVLLVAMAPHHYLSVFASIMKPFSRNRYLHFGFVSLKKHADWVNTVLSAAGCESLPGCDPAEITLRNAPVCVIAINPHRRYFCIMRSNLESRISQQASTDDDKMAFAVMNKVLKDERRRSSPTSSSEPGNEKSARQQSAGISAGSLFRPEWALTGLDTWMERLFEGTLPRYYVSNWPGM